MPTDTYPLQDLLYRTTALTDDGGDIVEAYDTDAYGNTLVFDAPGTGGDWWADDAQQTDEPTCEFIFTGRRYDSETGLYFYRARYYSPTLGRFISRDPTEFRGGSNLYQLMNGGPLTTVDPDGLAPIPKEVVIKVPPPNPIAPHVEHHTLLEWDEHIWVDLPVGLFAYITRTFPKNGGNCRGVGDTIGWDEEGRKLGWQPYEAPKGDAYAWDAKRGCIFFSISHYITEKRRYRGKIYSSKEVGCDECEYKVALTERYGWSSKGVWTVSFLKYLTKEQCLRRNDWEMRNVEF
jgi:RHS repeat-associated protein